MYLWLLLCSCERERERDRATVKTGWNGQWKDSCLWHINSYDRKYFYVVIIVPWQRIILYGFNMIVVYMMSKSMVCYVNGTVALFRLNFWTNGNREKVMREKRTKQRNKNDREKVAQYDDRNKNRMQNFDTNRLDDIYLYE